MKREAELTAAADKSEMIRTVRSALFCVSAESDVMGSGTVVF
jgi:hypothetical protein